SDIFVADVTTINSEQDGGSDKFRPCPNPNVVFELGYAVAHLGWNRIVLFFNEAFGKPNQLPFDFDRHRAALFTLTDNASKDEHKQLTELARNALVAIIKSAPKKPHELRGGDEQKIRQRDIASLVSALEKLHIP